MGKEKFIFTYVYNRRIFNVRVSSTYLFSFGPSGTPRRIWASQTRCCYVRFRGARLKPQVSGFLHYIHSTFRMFSLHFVYLLSLVCVLVNF